LWLTLPTVNTEVFAQDKLALIRSKFEYQYDNNVTAITTWQYEVSTDAAIRLRVDVQLTDTLPSIPRVGLTFDLAAGAQTNNVKWLGLGPVENYPDRKAGVRFGAYQSNLDDLHTPYLFPTENGLRCDTKLLSIGGLQFAGNFNFSASEYSAEQLTKATHTVDLVKSGRVYVNIDHVHMGIGGDDSWSPSVHPEHLVEGTRYQYELVIRLV